MNRGISGFQTDGMPQRFPKHRQLHIPTGNGSAAETKSYFSKEFIFSATLRF